jgi:hypothetical protein
VGALSEQIYGSGTVRVFPYAGYPYPAVYGFRGCLVVGREGSLAFLVVGREGSLAFQAVLEEFHLGFTQLNQVSGRTF